VGPVVLAVNTEDGGAVDIPTANKAFITILEEGTTVEQLHNTNLVSMYAAQLLATYSAQISGGGTGLPCQDMIPASSV
jgi:hypothetical protein